MFDYLFISLPSNWILNFFTSISPTTETESILPISNLSTHLIGIKKSEMQCYLRSIDSSLKISQRKYHCSIRYVCHSRANIISAKILHQQPHSQFLICIWNERERIKMPSLSKCVYIFAFYSMNFQIYCFTKYWNWWQMAHSCGSETNFAHLL